MFDITPFLAPGDPWLAGEDPELVRQLYAQKYHIAAILQPHSIVEIGVRAGYSAAAFLSAAADCTYLGLDLDTDAYGGWPGALVVARTMLGKHFGGRAKVLTVNTQRLESLPCGPVDLVHVDGDHSLDGCRHDLRLAARVARWILVDDIEWQAPVRAAANECVLRHGYRCLELPTVRGDLLIDVRSSERTYSHGGDTGDLIYALATVKSLGGGRLLLTRNDRVREPFTPAKVESLRAFLEAQPYITGVEYRTSPAGLDLDAWRNHYREELSICDMVASTFGVPHYPREEPWLSCPDPNPVARVIIARSARYHGNEFPWRRVREAYGAEAVFVGLPEEHAAWQDQFGPVPYYPTPDWWQLCRVIKGARVFAGNQSAPMAMALGLCVPRIIQEVCLYTPNCHFERRGVAYGRDANVALPPL
jgi:hypothetical protein